MNIYLNPNLIADISTAFLKQANYISQEMKN